MDMVRGLCVWPLLLVAVASAGGGGSVHEHPLSKAQFISRADAICMTGNKRINFQGLRSRSAAEAGEEQRMRRLSNDLAALQQRENGANEELWLKQCVSNGEAED
jgi:hypothetical protein